MWVAIPSLNAAVEKTADWLHTLAREGRFESELQAYQALRGVLHALRDRLPPGEAADLGAQLPMLVRGFYFEGWRPGARPTRERSGPQFARSVRMHLRDNPRIDEVHAIRAVFDFLNRRISAGEIDDVRGILPDEIRRFWPPRRAERRRDEYIRYPIDGGPAGRSASASSRDEGHPSGTPPWLRSPSTRWLSRSR